MTSTPIGLFICPSCATVGASYTTLRDCCQEYLGMSPNAICGCSVYLVRRALRIADAEDDRDRDRDRLWLLGIGPLCGHLPVTIGEPPRRHSVDPRGTNRWKSSSRRGSR